MSDVKVPTEEGATRAAGFSDVARRVRLAGPNQRQIAALVAALVILFAVGGFTSPYFLQPQNLILLVTQASTIGVISVGMTFVIISGGIDLSVGGLTALASVWATTGATQAFGLPGMLLAAMAVGIVCGLLNGILIAYVGLGSLIVTLAGFASYRGMATVISGSQPQVVHVPALSAIATARPLGIPLLVYIFAAAVVLGWLLLNRTTFGRHVFAVGGNQEAARLAGINVRRVRATVFVITGVCCGVAAIMLTARAHTGASTHAQLYELNAIAAVILGGTLLSGGRGTLLGTILGVIVFSTITNLFILNGLSTPIQQVAKGAIIVAAILLQRRATKQAATT